ncbi:hypothetical protein EON77_18980, partial [bacterium]
PKAGLALQQWRCNGASAQQFRVEALADGRHRLTNAASKLALSHSHAGALAPGASVVQNAANDGDGEGFVLVPRPDGAFDVTVPGTDLSVDVADGSIEPGAALRLWTRNDSAAQGFRLWPVR